MVSEHSCLMIERAWCGRRVHVRAGQNQWMFRPPEGDTPFLIHRGVALRFATLACLRAWLATPGAAVTEVVYAAE